MKLSDLLTVLADVDYGDAEIKCEDENGLVFSPYAFALDTDEEKTITLLFHVELRD